jgi:hypothetical protein
LEDARLKTTDTDCNALRRETLDFVARHRVPDAGAGAYRYSPACAAPTLYSSTYAAMTRALFGDLDGLGAAERQAWIDALNARQDDDGLFRDPVIDGAGWYRDDPLWCGRPHLTCHAVTALACLGGQAAKPMRFLDPWRSPDRMQAWLAGRDWGGRVAWTGNEIMNVGTLLQYARDVHNNDDAGKAVTAMLEWLSRNHVDPASGVWGDMDLRDPVKRSHAVQAAYHWWPLFAYDGHPVPHVERAIDTLLDTQNPLGGFGWGVHNPDAPYESSACEDIDSIDPLARFSLQTDYRNDGVRRCLAKAADRVLRNRTPDGGFVFIRNRAFEYGHPQLRSERGMGAMFPTWFRTLSLALIGQALPAHPLGRCPWRFVDCPGWQFRPAGRGSPVAARRSAP